MPELRQLHDLTAQVHEPELDRLADLADGRRRRTARVVATGVAASLVLAVLIAAGAVRDRDPRSGTTVTRQAAIWRRPDGTFAAKLLPIGDSRGGPGMLRAGREVPSGVDSGARGRDATNSLFGPLPTTRCVPSVGRRRGRARCAADAQPPAPV